MHRKYNIDLDESFSALIYAVLFLALIWTLMTSYLIYGNFFNNIKTRIETRSVTIGLAAEEVVGAVDNYLNYVGDKILAFNDNNNSAIYKIIKRTPNRDFLQKNISSWINIDFVDNNGGVTVKTLGGILQHHTKPKNIFPIYEAVNEPWHLKIGNISHLENDITSFDYFPVAMTIENDIPKLVGTLTAIIPTDKIQQKINEVFNDGDLCYIAIDKNFDMIAKSENFHEYKKSYFTNNRASLHVLKNIEQKQKNYLGQKIISNNCSIIYYYHSSYNFAVFVGYDRISILKKFSFQIIALTMQAFGMAALFLVMFYFFRCLKITPFLNELVLAKNKAEEANEAKARFLSQMSHKLRTPINGVIGMSQALCESQKLPKEESEQIEIINSSANDLLIIINEIIEFSENSPIIKEELSETYPTKKKPKTKKKSKTLKILLCEDNEINLKVTTMLLKRMNIEVEVAKNGKEAIKKFQQKKYDIIFIDCSMPIIDGYEATKKIRLIEKENIQKNTNLGFSHTPIIALTANVTNYDHQKCLEAGMDDFIAKPATREIIESKIAKWCN